MGPETSRAPCSLALRKMSLKVAFLAGSGGLRKCELGESYREIHEIRARGLLSTFDHVVPRRIPVTSLSPVFDLRLFSPYLCTFQESGC